MSDYETKKQQYLSELKIQEDKWKKLIDLPWSMIVQIDKDIVNSKIYCIKYNLRHLDFIKWNEEIVAVLKQK